MSEKTHKPRQGSTSPACLREAINSEKKRFFLKSLHKMVTPPSPFYEIPIFSRPFFDEKKDDFEGCLKGVQYTVYILPLFAGDVPSRELLLASMTAFMSKAFGAIVVMPIPPMPYIITMLEAGAIILNTFWAVTPLAQLLTTETMSQSTPSSLSRPSSGTTFAFRILTAVSG